jgi:hypothetical protein
MATCCAKISAREAFKHEIQLGARLRYGFRIRYASGMQTIRQWRAARSRLHLDPRGTKMNKYAALLTSVLALSACAPVIWSRPDTPPQMAEMDRARCQLIANTGTVEVDHRSIFHNSSQNFGDAIADGIINGIQKGENFSLCMRVPSRFVLEFAPARSPVG